MGNGGLEVVDIRSSNGEGGEEGMSPAGMIIKEAKAMEDRPDSKSTSTVFDFSFEPEVLEEDRKEEEKEGESVDYPCVFYPVSPQAS